MACTGAPDRGGGCWTCLVEDTHSGVRAVVQLGSEPVNMAPWSQSIPASMASPSLVGAGGTTGAQTPVASNPHIVCGHPVPRRGSHEF